MVSNAPWKKRPRCLIACQLDLVLVSSLLILRPIRPQKSKDINMKTWVFSVTIHLILVITIAEIGLCRPHYGQTTPTKFRNYQPNVQMVQRCLRALNRGNLGIKPKYLCQALIKTFLLEQKAINTNQNLNKLNHLDINKNNKESNVSILKVT